MDISGSQPLHMPSSEGGMTRNDRGNRKETIIELLLIHLTFQFSSLYNQDGTVPTIITTVNPADNNQRTSGTISKDIINL